MKALTRADVMEKIRIPETSDHVVIIKARANGLGFIHNSYWHDILRGVISRDEFEVTVK